MCSVPAHNSADALVNLNVVVIEAKSMVDDILKIR